MFWYIMISLRLPYLWTFCIFSGWASVRPPHGCLARGQEPEFHFNFHGWLGGGVRRERGRGRRQPLETSFPSLTLSGVFYCFHGCRARKLFLMEKFIYGLWYITTTLWNVRTIYLHMSTASFYKLSFRWIDQIGSEKLFKGYILVKQQ